MDISVVIPCYRSERTLGSLVDRLFAELDRLQITGRITEYEVILVVDGSPDKTAEIARAAISRHSDLRVIELTRNFGQHNALVAGIRQARNRVTVTMDDDLQHPPEQIGRLLEVLGETIDLVYAVPFAEEHGFLRSLGSRTVKRGLRLAGVPNATLISAFRAFRTELRNGFANSADPGVNLDVLLSWATNRVTGAQVELALRADGTSTYSFRRLVRHTLNMVTGYGIVPLRIATWLGFGCGILGFVLLLVTLFQYFLGETAVQGYTTTIATIAIFAGAQMVALGVIGEYIGRQHFRSIGRPMYVLRSED